MTCLSLDLLFQDPFFGDAGSSICVYFPPEIRGQSLCAISDNPGDMEEGSGNSIYSRRTFARELAR